jgi:arylformamidase
MLTGCGVISRLRAAFAVVFAAASLGACAHTAPAAPEPVRDIPVVAAPPKAPQDLVWRDVAYGAAPLQKLDVYANSEAKNAPVIIMVHGGGWKTGDKGLNRVVDNKAVHYLAKGYVFVSINYRMLPEAYPLEQARDVAKALAFVQTNAKVWGADPKRIVLMGHSAGAHLVALINAAPSFAKDAGADVWLGVVALDSSAYDVERLMTRKHGALYDEAFGVNKDYWRHVSPAANVGGRPAPMLLVCSTQYGEPCAQANVLKAALAKYEGSAHIVQVPLSHMDINADLGAGSDYTRKVDDFLAGLGLP